MSHIYSALQTSLIGTAAAGVAIWYLRDQAKKIYAFYRIKRSLKPGMFILIPFGGVTERFGTIEKIGFRRCTINTNDGYCLKISTDQLASLPWQIEQHRNERNTS